LIAAGEQWAVLLRARGSERVRAHRVLYLSQLAKYLPAGGFVQAASQISATDTKDSSVGSRAAVFGIGLAQLVASACLVGGLLIFGTDWRIGLGVLSLLVGGALALPGSIQWLSGFVQRRMRRGVVPERSSGELRRAQAWSLANVLSLSLAFSLLQSEVANAEAAGAFALAWLGGFLVAPIPAGLGIREALLAAFLVDAATGPLVLAALILRVLGLLAEVLLGAGSLLLERLSDEPASA
jgi:hypothetical protein